MKTIRVNLPEEIAEHLSSMGESQQDFIAQAIKEKIGRKEALKEDLIEGYQATYQEDRQLTDDFEAADFEDWK